MVCGFLVCDFGVWFFELVCDAWGLVQDVILVDLVF